MSEALSVYETLPPEVKKEVNDFIFFLADRLKFADAEKKDFMPAGSALQKLKKYRGRIPADFDMNQEQASARDEKYGV